MSKKYTSNNSVIVATKNGISLYKDGKKVFYATKHSEYQYYCASLGLTITKTNVITIFRAIAKKCF